jgi:DNA primase
MINIDTIVQRNTIVEYATDKGAVLTRSNDEWRGRCPIHKGENETAFVIYDDGEKQRYKCWTHDECGSGDIIDFVMRIECVDMRRAIEILGGDPFVSTEEIQHAAAERVKRAELWEAKKRAEHEQALSELHQARTWEAYYNYAKEHEEVQSIWAKRGIPIDWQEFWQLGACPKFAYKSKDKLYYSPTLTIPIFDDEHTDPINIRHRLLQPIDPGDKYRPERPHLGATPFMANLYHNKTTSRVLVVEGEIKAAVTYIWLDMQSEFQVFGIPGKKAFQSLVPQLQGRDVWLCFDPDAKEQTVAAAKQVKGRIVPITMKIDDALNCRALNTQSLRRLINMGRKVI